MLRSGISLIILAGGDGSRMRPASLITPKPILTVFDEPLLVRQIRQANEAGIKNIIVSTNPKDISKIRKVIKLFKLNAKVIENNKHKHGSLSALEYVLGKVTTEKVLMSFSDIFFVENPFINIRKMRSNVLGVSEAFDNKELAMGGIVFADKKSVKHIVEKPLKGNRRGSRWNGLAIFDRECRTYLKDFLMKYPMDCPEENFFEYLMLKRKLKFTTIFCPDFININYPDALVVASIYRLSETRSNPKIYSLANKIREQILLKRYEGK